MLGVNHTPPCGCGFYSLSPAAAAAAAAGFLKAPAAAAAAAASFLKSPAAAAAAAAGHEAAAYFFNFYFCLISEAESTEMLEICKSLL